MKKNIFLLLFALFSFSAIYAEEDNGINWNLSEDGTLTISGTGDMPDYGDNDAPWYKDRKKIKEVVIEKGVTSIGMAAFFWCVNLTSITIPNSVRSIGEAAFEKCSSLTSVTIPNSVTSIGGNAFFHCTSLTSVTIPNSVTSIGVSAFEDCSGLTSITIPNSVTSIGMTAFYFCANLTSITIPNSVTSLGTNSFAGCLGLTSITFKGSTPPKFGEDVFGWSTATLVSVSVPANSIEAYKSALGGLGLLNINIKAAPLIYLKDGEAYTQDSQIDGMDIYYTRNFTNTNWQALYLPFSLNYEDWKDDFEVAYINTVRQYDDNGDGRADRTIMEAVKKNSGSTAPNTPYLIRAKTAGEKTFFVENATLYPAENNSVDCSTTTARFTFTGTYQKATFGGLARNYYGINEGRLSVLNITLPVPPYRWYMSVGTRSSVYDTSGWGWAKEISISVVGEEETTGVEELRIMNYELPDDKLPVYDLNGRKVDNLKPGIYVKNGKKFVVR